MAERKTDKQKGDTENFEAALERLENIVREMEGGALGLETMIERFEEGRKLIGFCSKKLNEVERRIDVLVKQGDTLSTEPFEPEPDDALKPEGEACPF